MIINIGSMNGTKISALKEIAQEYDFLSNAQITPIAVQSDVSRQPRSLEETIQGAINRAKSAFNGCSLSIGIESGFMQAPYTKSGYLNTCCCAIYDGTNVHLGLSSSFEYPVSAVRLVLDDGSDISEVFYNLGLAADASVGSKEGAISILTKGRTNRKEYTKESIRAALIHLDNPGLY